MSTLQERRDVFWKAKARRFAIQCNAEAHRRRKAEIKASDAVGTRKSVVKQLRITRNFARAWKLKAKDWRQACYSGERDFQDNCQRITELEDALRDFKDQPHVCRDRGSSVTLLECSICILKYRVKELLKKIT